MDERDLIPAGDQRGAKLSPVVPISSPVICQTELRAALVSLTTQVSQMSSSAWRLASDAPGVFSMVLYAKTERLDGCGAG